MTQLSDQSITSLLISGELVINPLIPSIQPASVDLHLYGELQILPRILFNPAEPHPIYPEILPFKQHTLLPGGFLLGSTLEYLELPGFLVAVVTGKSSLARLGLQVEAAGYVDPGWKGQLTLELVNLGPMMITLRAGMPICQIRFEYLDQTPTHLYGDPLLGSHYQGSAGPISARFDPSPSEVTSPSAADGLDTIT